MLTEARGRCTRSVWGVLLAAATLTLAGCGSDQPSTVNQPSQDPQAERDAVYLQMAHDVAPEVTDEHLMDLRKNLCAVLDEKPTRSTYLLTLGMALKGGLSSEQAGTINATAVASGCPQHTDLVKP